MGKADLHIHTVFSWDGTCSVEAILKQAAHVAHLDVIAITDHDDIRGALDAEDLAYPYGIDVIPGSEISTADGHLLALFIREKIPAGLSLSETVLRVQDKGGLCIVPHPEAKMTQSINRAALKTALQNSAVAHTLRGIETYNAGLFDRKANALAADLAKDFSLAPIGASDSHMLWTIGHGITLFPGSSAADLQNALLNNCTTPKVVKNSGNAFILLSWLRGYLLRRAGWVEYNRFPSAPVKLQRIPSLAKFVAAK
jgi:predicted metal-dependent phosphoesterase TrpH